MVPETGAEGVIIAQGANLNGWSLYAKDGKFKYRYNFFGFKNFVRRVGARRFPTGNHQVRMEFNTTAAATAKGGAVTLYVDGKSVGQGRIERDRADRRSPLTTTCDVGKETGSPVSPDYGPHGNEFSGEVNWRADRDLREGRSRSPD